MSSMKSMHPGSPSDPSWTTAERGKAELRIFNFKTTWSEFHTSEFHHFPRVGPKQLCALAHLGSTRAAGTSQSIYYSETVHTQGRNKVPKTGGLSSTYLFWVVLKNRGFYGTPSSYDHVILTYDTFLNLKALNQGVVLVSWEKNELNFLCKFGE